jgi:HSP20 family protein
MQELILWKNKEINRIRRDLEDMLHRHCRNFDLPPVSDKILDISETEDTLILSAEIPDADPEDIDISVMENSLLISARIEKKTVTKGEQFRRVDKQSTSFKRKITLPCRIEVETIKATYKNNILKIVMPKCGRPIARTIRPEIQ